MNDTRLRIIVSGMVARYPVGGVAWDYLQYVLGLSRLGHDVYYHEDTWSWPYHPVKNTVCTDGEYSGSFLDHFFRSYAPALERHWHYDHLHEVSYGMSRDAFAEVARTSDLFINVSGALMIPPELNGECIKVFLDTDPGYNQIMLLEKCGWSENVERWCDLVAEHDRHFTYAENMGQADCRVPDTGFRWQTTRMPVLVDLWEPLHAKEPPTISPWTTVMTWNDFKGKLVYQGVEYKSKGEEFEKIIDLPPRVTSPLRIAVGGTNVPRERLTARGWDVVDGPEVTLTPESYRYFVWNSRGEISIAKHVYVALRTGWFSCRSVCYMAAGRPVVVQDTGFSRLIPCGDGLLPFNSIVEAARHVESVENDYQRHSTAAQEIAREYFEATNVLADFIEKAIA